jgi:8-oxo-dGTP pyrophosphatase MutT (NUDIX family)
VYPGGLVDAHDTWHDTQQDVYRIAALRETFEETGLFVSFGCQSRSVGSKSLSDWRLEVLL